MIVNRLMLQIVALALVATSLRAETDCVFDNNYYSAVTYSGNSKVRDVLWDDARKEALILTSSLTAVSVKHWTCNEVGLEAVMLVHPAAASPADLREKMIELSDIVLRDPERSDFQKALTVESTIPIDEYRRMAGPANRGDFFYIVRRLPEFDSITIKYYYN